MKIKDQFDTISSKPKAPTNTTAIALSGRFKRGTFHLTRPGTRVLRTPTPTHSPRHEYRSKTKSFAGPYCRNGSRAQRHHRPSVKSPSATLTRRSWSENVSFETEGREGGGGGGGHVPILMDVMRRPHALRMTPMLLAVTPLPRPLTTPPVTRTYFISPCPGISGPTNPPPPPTLLNPPTRATVLGKETARAHGRTSWRYARGREVLGGEREEKGVGRQWRQGGWGIEGGGLWKERGPFIRPKIPQFSRFFFVSPTSLLCIFWARPVRFKTARRGPYSHHICGHVVMELPALLRVAWNASA